MAQSLLHKAFGLAGHVSDRRPTRDEFTGLNIDSPQYRNLTACFPMWDGVGAPCLDLASGLIGYPSNTRSYVDPIMGVVYRGDNGNVPRGGGAATTRRFIQVPTPLTSQPHPMDPGWGGTASLPIGNARSFSMTAWVNFTVDGWTIQGADINTTDNTPPNQYVCTFASANAPFPGWGIAVTSNNSATNIVAELDVDGNASQATIVGNIPLNDGRWHLIAGVYDVDGLSIGGSNDGGHMRIYVDGVLDTTEANGGAGGTGAVVVPAVQSPFTGTAPYVLSIGSDNDLTGAEWNGLFCDFRFYMRALQPADIQAMYVPETRWDLYRPQRRMSYPIGSGTVFTVSVSGGAVVGGSPIPTAIFKPSAAGGAVGGGLVVPLPIFAPPVSGGAIAGGVLTPTATFGASAAGGPVAGGLAVPLPIFVPAAAGGAIAGGTAGPTTTFKPPVAGGAVAGGILTPVLSIAGQSSGGGVVGGTAQGAANNVFTATASGGAVAGGLATPSAIFAGSSTGGPVAGGLAIPLPIFAGVSTGGGVAGGTAQGALALGLWSYVQGAGTSTTGGTSLSKAFTSPVAAGDLIVVTGLAGVGRTLTVADSQSNTYQVVRANITTTPVIYTWYATATATGTLTVTITSSTSSVMDIVVDEYSYSASPITYIVAGTAFGSGTGTAPTAGPIAYTGNGLDYGAMVATNAAQGTITPASGYTTRYSVQYSAAVTWGISVQDHVNDFSGAAQPAATYQNSVAWIENAAVFLAVPLSTAPSSGGVVAGGTAAGTDSAFIVTGSGGPVMGGVLTPSATLTATASGGLVAGGNAQGLPLIYIAIVSGGPAAGGSAMGILAPFFCYIDPTKFIVIPL